MAEKRKPLNKMVEVLSMRLGMDSADVQRFLENRSLEELQAIEKGLQKNASVKAIARVIKETQVLPDDSITTFKNAEEFQNHIRQNLRVQQRIVENGTDFKVIEVDLLKKIPSLRRARNG